MLLRPVLCWFVLRDAESSVAFYAADPLAMRFWVLFKGRSEVVHRPTALLDYRVRTQRVWNVDVVAVGFIFLKPNTVCIKSEHWNKWSSVYQL